MKKRRQGSGGAREVDLELELGALAPGGDAVAHAVIDDERRAIFVRGGAPGDRARVRVDLAHKPARGRLLELLAPGASRAAPPCAYADRCGGCDWMHLSREAQAGAHVDQLRAALPPAWRTVDVFDHRAPAALGWRVRARVHVRASGGRAIVGMNEARTHEPVEVDACVVLHPRLEEARRTLSALLEGAHGRGDASLALGAPPARTPVLDLRWTGGDLPAQVFARLERAVRAGAWAGARVSAGDARRPAIVGDPTPWMIAEDGAPLRLAPAGFGQASEATNAALVRRVAEIAAEAARGERITELYAGAGNLTVALAPIAKEVVAIESQREACEAARANLAARGLSARVVEADAATYAWSPATRLLVLDPPRTGAREVTARLAQSKTRHVVYVSCDAQTLGRDLLPLADLYAPRAVECFEMFPQTSHAEALVWLERVRR